MLRMYTCARRFGWTPTDYDNASTITTDWLIAIDSTITKEHGSLDGL